MLLRALDSLQNKYIQVQTDDQWDFAFDSFIEKWFSSLPQYYWDDRLKKQQF